MFTNNAPDDFSCLEGFFDVVLTDVPCSGEGMFRKDPQSISEWSEANVKMCSERQRNILRSIWDSLKPGGLLIYSTCTYNTLEDEENVKWISEELGAEILNVPIEAEWGSCLDAISRYSDSFPTRLKVKVSLHVLCESLVMKN